MSVIAKFQCEGVEDTSQSETDQSRQITMRAVIAYGEDGKRYDENESWAKYTPTGDLRMSITNPDAFNQFEKGKNYYLTFEKVSE